MSPVNYANALVRTHGIEYATKMADSLAKTAEEVVVSGGVPVAEEIEITKYESFSTDDDGNKKLVTKERITIDEASKAKRLKTIMVFWRNVNGYLKKKNLKKSLKDAGKTV